jgi:hypothetical protein
MSDLIAEDASIPGSAGSENPEMQQQIKSIVLNLSTGILNGMIAGLATIPGQDFNDNQLKENLIATSVNYATNLYNFVNSLNFSMQTPTQQ